MCCNRDELTGSSVSYDTLPLIIFIKVSIILTVWCIGFGVVQFIVCGIHLAISLHYFSVLCKREYKQITISAYSINWNNFTVEYEDY